MATQNFTGTTSLPAAADFTTLSGHGYRAVQRNSAGEAALSAAGGYPYGIMDGDKVRKGQQTRIEGLEGRKQLKMDCGGPIAFNDEVGSDAEGRLVKITTTGQFVFGRADEAGVLGQVVSFTPLPPFAKPA